jgi:hypothetical protein
LLNGGNTIIKYLYELCARANMPEDACPCAQPIPVGGEVLIEDKLALMTPYIITIILMMIASVVIGRARN